MTDVNLTSVSTTFPELAGPEIPRDNLIGFLKDRFSPEHKVIIVQGPVGAGKTTLLAQFGRTVPSRSFTYFVGTTLPSSDARYFLLDLCEQMGALLGRSTEGLERLETESLKQSFVALYRRVAQEAKRETEPFYFVIDGLEWIPVGVETGSILSLLPAEPTRNIRLLLSSEKARSFRFPCDRWDIIFFSLQESLTYLHGLRLSDDEIRSIHDNCQGMPGYLAAMRRLLRSGVGLKDLPSKLPTELSGIFRIEWDRMSVLEEDSRILALLAYAKEPLGVAALAGMAELSAAQVREIVERVSFLKVDPRTEAVAYISDAYKEFVIDRLSARREDSEELLIGNYLKAPYEKSSLKLLPTYLASPSRYGRLRSLITADYVVRSLGAGRDVSMLRQNLKISAVQAAKSEDLVGSYRFALAGSILRTVSTETVGEGEIEALLGLRDFGRAFDLAYQAILPEDRLHLLALVCSRMRQAELSVPDGVATDLDQMARAIDPIPLGSRAFEIAAPLFDTLPETAVDLVERFASGRKGERSVDWARALLAVRLETDEKGFLKTRISDPTIQDFARAHSRRIGRLSAEEAVAEAEKVKSTSARLQILTAWCNENRENSTAHVAVGKALEIITGDPSYGTPMRQLRQLAEALKVSPPEATGAIVERLEILKNTAIKSPVQEVVRLELLIAALEENLKKGRGIDRLYQTYLDLDNVGDLDVRCYCLVRLLITLKEAGFDDTRLRDEVESRVASEYQQLLSNSAEHLETTKRIIRALTTYKLPMAMEFASKLNTRYRRDQSREQVLRVYSREYEGAFDCDLVDQTLGSIEDINLREIATVKLVENLAERKAFVSSPDTRRYIARIDSLRDPWDRCHAWAYAISCIAGTTESSLAESLQKRVVEDSALEDSLWNRVSLMFDVAQIVAETAPSFARSVIARAKQDLSSNPLAEGFFAHLYVNCLLLALRSLSGVLTGDALHQEHVVGLVNAIRVVPSRSVQAHLFADLAVRLLQAGKANDFQKVTRDEVMPLIETAPNEYAQEQAFVFCDACLFEYDSGWYLDRVKGLGYVQRHVSLSEVGKYLLSGRSRYDPVDMKRLRTQVDVRTAHRIIQVLEAMDHDSPVSSLMDNLVATLVQKDLNNPPKEICIPLIERNALDLATQLEEIATRKFPDQGNIKHKGYLVVAKACVARLRAAASWRFRPTLPWPQIRGTSEEIPNTADKVFVLATVAESMYPSAPDLARSCIREAEGLISTIPNIIDRADRLHTVAQAFHNIDENEAAKRLLRDAMGMVKDLSSEGSREEITNEVLQLAHTIDPDFAANLTPLVDNPVMEHENRLSLMARNFHRNPGRLEQGEIRDPESRTEALATAAMLMLESLNSGVGQIRHPREVGEWIIQGADSEFDKFYKIGAWAIQNTLHQTKQHEILMGLLRGILDCVSLCSSIGRILFGIRADLIPVEKVGAPGDLRLFRAGSRDAAVASIRDWLRDQVKGYAKIYDPYFTPSDLEYVKEINRDVRVYVLTSWKAQAGLSPGDRRVESVYRAAWQSISDQEPPWTQVTVLGTKSGDSPIHSRYILTEGEGLALSTSLRGLGLKDTDLHTLSRDEASSIEQEFVNPLLAPQWKLYKGEPLIIHIFVL